MIKSKKLVKRKDPNCLNCGFPFSGQENFCPECGQKNKGSQLTFGTFLKEVFNGFVTWDAKFWKTIIPLLIKPGKVSKDYVDGMRIRYANPFRFYISTSIIFFLVFGLISGYNKINDLSTGKASTSKRTTPKINVQPINTDSLRTSMEEKLSNSFIPIDSVTRSKIIDEVEKSAKDTTRTGKRPNRISFGGFTRLDRFITHNREHPKMNVNDALDSLKAKKTFMNRFLYNRAQVANSFVDEDDKWRDFIKQMLSYGSIAMFILLPVFTLFIKFIYIRRKHTYVEHLIFVFHTQTVFFLLLTFFVILDFFTNNAESWLFMLLFLIYLFIAMKRFYGQGYFKTFLKYCMINTAFMFFAIIGAIFVGLASFAFI